VLCADNFLNNDLGARCNIHGLYGICMEYKSFAYGKTLTSDSDLTKKPVKCDA
jgi:hypothetical protein